MALPLNILLVEDNNDDALLIVDELQSGGFRPKWARVENERSYLENLGPHLDLIISDFTLPRFSTNRALELLHQSKLDVPLIIVSGTIGEERAIEALKAGATDYVLKDRLRRLVPAVHRAVREMRERRERKQLEVQFRQAQKMESIGQLAGGIAHDFNNILTVINGHAALLSENSSLDSDARDSASEIALAAERAAGLTRQLLTFSRKQVLQTRALNLNDVIEGVLKMLRRVLGADIALKFQPGELPTIVADAGMLEQILMNLVVNARDAMPIGGTLKIETGQEVVPAAFAEQNPEMRAGNFVWLQVSDTGHGIEPGNMPKIFEPFFTTKEVGKGTGLGLATVYGIVKQHRGWVTLQSELNVGTTFKIFLPAETPCAATHGPKSLNEVRGGHETILVVEDEYALRELVRDVLESYGYRVLTADSGTAALRVWQEHGDSIDLLLTDLVMPGGLNGRQLAEKLLEERATLHVVYTSGYSAEVMGPSFPLREGINFLQKPYPPRTLAACVRANLDGSR